MRAFRYITYHLISRFAKLNIQPFIAIKCVWQAICHLATGYLGLTLTNTISGEYECKHPRSGVIQKLNRTLYLSLILYSLLDASVNMH